VNAREYLDEVVAPTVERLRTSPGDRSLAMAAAILVNHAADWIAEGDDDELRVVRNAILSECPEYERLRAVADAHKHMKLRDRRPTFAGLTNPLTPAAIEEITYCGEAITFKGEPITWETFPEYRFADGQAWKPIELIDLVLDGILEVMDSRAL